MNEYLGSEMEDSHLLVASLYESRINNFANQKKIQKIKHLQKIKIVKNAFYIF